MLKEDIEAPPFILSDLEGRQVGLREFQGKFIMLNFWATWWTFCDRERSSLEKIHNLYGKKGMIVLAISTDQGSDEEARKKVKSYASRKKLTFLNLLDPKSSTSAQYTHRYISIGLAFLAGVASFLSPCVFTLVPAYIE